MLIPDCSYKPDTQPTEQGTVDYCHNDSVSEKDVAARKDEDFIPSALLRPDGLGLLRNGINKHFYSNGAFNLVQLVLYVLKQTGPAGVFLSTYSIAEESVARLRREFDRGNITDIRFLIDNRVRTISPKPFDALVGTFPGRYRCCALHAKVALIYNSEWHISVVGSQNATHNPKLERGIIHTEPEVFVFDYNVLRDEFERGTT